MRGDIPDSEFILFTIFISIEVIVGLVCTNIVFVELCF